MRNTKNRNQRGDVVVEATILLPIAILSVILLMYVSILLCQKAILQASLETCAVYFKNTLTDNFVTQTETLEEQTDNESGVTGHIGNRYKAEKPLNPYAKFFNTSGKKVDDIEKEFRPYFDSVKKSMVFDENVTLKIDYTNWILFREITLIAEQDVTLPIDFSMLGVDNKMHFAAKTRVAVVDNDELIRNMDYAVDIIEDTKLGTWWKNAGSKISEGYNKLKEKLY